MAAQREWFEKDYYAVLGVAPGASEKELSRAYKKLAKQHHPDANAGNPEAEERFKEVNAAYDVLGDTEKRKEYDEVRRMVASGVGPGGFGSRRRQLRTRAACSSISKTSGGLGDLLGNLFGGRGGRGRRSAHTPQRGQDLETELHLSFDDAVHGVTSTVRFRADAVCSTCHGTGAAPGTLPETCPQCHGSGSIAVDQGPFSFSQVCPTCGGRGQVVPTPCPTCRGRGVEVRAPRGEGTRAGRCQRRSADPGQGPRRRGRQRRSGGRPLCRRAASRRTSCSAGAAEDLTLRLPVTFAEAALGADVKVPTLDGQVTVRIAPGTPSGKVLRVRGQGVPGDETKNGKRGGDLLVTIDVVVPTELDDRQREAVEALAAATDADPRAGLFAATDRKGSDG